jgi:hypothetical protein
MAFGLLQLLWQQPALGRSGLKAGQGLITSQDLALVLAWTGGCVALVVLTLQAWQLAGPW